ncbi:alpha/beta fold hydrolase [Streptomyces sp. S.PB5]|uniref:thioesterase II family protein n=1 Tax=Streptomyces sp. S.PB5 TaxID=3020844 RepID=UPI0025B225EE|nr:alpha/beta fold hydrolase [Streptomyces sp. S.PB5]MDN3028485.1 alpha/beta fold hydrolase [Streptomyces sp. S.PB5]
MDGTRPELRLFVLHHAGGSHVPYRRWPAGLPDTWDVRLLDAPGHGHLLDLPQISDAGRLADFLIDAVKPELTCPYALFGHSMGALVSYEMTRRLVGRGLPLPVWVGVSARPAPQSAGPVSAYHELPEAELRSRLQALDGTPEGVFDDPELWALLEPVIRADLRLVESWRPGPDTGPLPVALSAFAGREDHSASPARMAGWEEHAEHFLGLRVFDGGHFYFQDDPGPLLRQIARDAATALDAAGAARSF